MGTIQVFLSSYFNLMPITSEAFILFYLSGLRLQLFILKKIKIVEEIFHGQSKLSLVEFG